MRSLILPAGWWMWEGSEHRDASGFTALRMWLHSSLSPRCQSTTRPLQRHRLWLVHARTEAHAHTFTLSHMHTYMHMHARTHMQNRMTEAITLFKHIVRERWFQKSSVILFLNKIDLLKEKLHTSSVSTYFPAFQGDTRDIVQVQEFFFSFFSKERAGLYYHYTCATDTGNIKFVFDAVATTIILQNLEEYHIS
jgi:hypothetical protein